MEVKLRSATHEGVVGDPGAILVVELRHADEAGVAAARHRWRLKRRRVLADRLSPDDWVCPSCLHSVSA